MASERVKLLIENLKLEKHIEGGYFSETYRSDTIIKKDCLPINFKSDRNLSTGIYFLLVGNEFSAFHKLKADEVWHFYEGSPIRIFVIDAKGNLKTFKLGNKIEKGEKYQIVIKSGQWFATEIIKKNSYSLVGCTVSPGFDFNDFELGNKKELIELFPKHRKIIEKLTK